MSELIEGKDYILDDKGRKVHPETGKQLKGFAINPKGINTGGRPKGSRNKASLLKAQISMDDNSEYAAELWNALMRNDKSFLGIEEDVPLTLRQSSAEKIMNKAIANEKDKDVPTPSTAKEEEEAKPKFSVVPVGKAKKG
jgi:hypothetical protein